MTLADDIAMLKGYSFNPAFDFVRNALWRPEQNHSFTQTYCDRAFVERFVFEPSTAHLLRAEWPKEIAIGDMVSRVPLPHSTMWLEVNYLKGERVGWFLSRAGNEIGVTVFTDTDRKKSFLSGILNLRTGLVHYDADRAKDFVDPLPLLGQWAVWCAAINAPAMAVAEEVRFLGEARRRRIRRGLPMFSYNVVRLIAPHTDIIRPTAFRRERQGTLRRHQSRGHWRLYIPDFEPPYFGWVVESQKGDLENGVIVKEHHVEIRRLEVRKGFLVPDFDGQPGMRVPALRAS